MAWGCVAMIWGFACSLRKTKAPLHMTLTAFAAQVAALVYLFVRVFVYEKRCF